MSLLAVLITVPQAFAILDIGVSVTPTSCGLHPPGLTSCSGIGSMNSDLPLGTMCLYETYDGNYLSVSVTLLNRGSPTGQNSTGPLTTNSQCRNNTDDVGFDFTVSYIAQTCVKGTYPVTFKATDGGYSNSTVFDAVVSCPQIPQMTLANT